MPTDAPNGHDLLVANFSTLKDLDAIIPPGRAASDGDIVNVSFGHGTNSRLIIEHQGHDLSIRWVVFDDIVSFRVQDECEMIGYWEIRSAEGLPAAFGYAIGQSCYLLEMRQGVTAIMNKERRLRHFLIGGRNNCVEAIAFEAPNVSTEKPSTS